MLTALRHYEGQIIDIRYKKQQIIVPCFIMLLVIYLLTVYRIYNVCTVLQSPTGQNAAEGIRRKDYSEVVIEGVWRKASVLWWTR